MEESPPPTVESDEPILVTSVDYCLLCGQIAVLYDLEGNVMKREMVDLGHEVTYQDLFDYLCVSLGLRKNSKLKKDWNFYTGPFPFCVDCEQLMQTLTVIYRQVDELNGTIKMKMTDAEDKYVRDELYERQDYRYLHFRKEALGEEFKGDIVMSRKRRMSRRQSKIKIESTTSIPKSEVKEEGPPSTSTPALVEHSIEPEASNSQPILVTEPQPSTSKAALLAKCRASSSKSTSFKGSQRSSFTSASSQDIKPLAESGILEVPENTLLNSESTTPLPGVRRSLRVRKKNTKYLEESPTLDKKFAAMVYTENFNTGVASEPILVHDDIKPFDERRRSSPPGRKRKRQSDDHGTSTFAFESGLFHKRPSSFRRHTNIENDLSRRPRDVKVNTAAYDSDWSPTAEQSSKRKRGRPRGSTNAVKREADSLFSPSATSGNFGSRKRYSERKLKIKFDLNADEETNSFCDGNDLYRVAPLVKDSLSGNIYYRTVQFVWVKEANAFQCSSCSVFIPNNVDNSLKDKFHKHYIKIHSDRFQCRLCPDWNRFQNDLELHNHFRHCHPGFFHIEPEIDCRSRPSAASFGNAAVIATASPLRVSEPRKSKNFQLKPCTICQKPMSTRDERAVEEHRLSHMNADEIETYVKNEQRFNSTRKYCRKLGDQVLCQFTTSSSSSTENRSNGSNVTGIKELKLQLVGVSSKVPKLKSRSCPFCGKDNISKDEFKKHRMTHMNKKERSEFLKKTSHDHKHKPRKNHRNKY